jgi:hypothetical protein
MFLGASNRPRNCKMADGCTIVWAGRAISEKLRRELGEGVVGDRARLVLGGVHDDLLLLRSPFAA